MRLSRPQLLPPLRPLPRPSTDSHLPELEPGLEQGLREPLLPLLLLRAPLLLQVAAAEVVLAEGACRVSVVVGTRDRWLVLPLVVDR